MSQSPGLLLKAKISWAKPNFVVASEHTQDFKLLLQAKPVLRATLRPSEATTKQKSQRRGRRGEQERRATALGLPAGQFGEKRANTSPG